MNLILLVSLKDHHNNQNWSLVEEIQGAVMRDEIKPLQSDGVIPVGRDAYLFDEASAHNSFVRVCSFLIGVDWPYIVAPIVVPVGTVSSVLVEGKCAPALQAILDKY